MNSREISLNRAQELKDHAHEFLKYKKKELQEHKKRRTHYLSMKKRLIEYFEIDEATFNDWKWQMAHRICDVDTLLKFVSFSETDQQQVQELSLIYRFAISPYYLALMTDDLDDPIRKLSVPNPLEAISTGELDPMKEEFTNPAGTITRRYPDRLIINVTNVCAMFCRHCQRRRNIGVKDAPTSMELINESIDYVRDNPEIRDVLLTGGDALLISDDCLEYILKELRKIDHVEIIRIGTRTPVTLPQRITTELVHMLSKYKPLYLNTQFNHHYEVTKDAIIATKKLSDAGIILGNQAVLLKGVNNHKFIMQLMNQMLLTAQVRPYYIFHCKHVKGIDHFITTIQEGLDIMEHLRGNTSGLAIPTYIMNAKDGKGKLPLLPNYITKISDKHYKIKTWEKEVFDYFE